MSTTTSPTELRVLGYLSGRGLCRRAELRLSAAERAALSRLVRRGFVLAVGTEEVQLRQKGYDHLRGGAS